MTISYVGPNKNSLDQMMKTTLIKDPATFDDLNNENRGYRGVRIIPNAPNNIYKNLQQGDEALFSKGGEALLGKVTQLNVYSSLEEAIKNMDLTSSSIPNSQEKEDMLKFGVLCIKIEAS